MPGLNVHYAEMSTIISKIHIKKLLNDVSLLDRWKGYRFLQGLVIGQKRGEASG